MYQSAQIPLYVARTTRPPGFLPESAVPASPAPAGSEVRIEDNKLFLERRWFHRGQPVYVESRDNSRYSAVISAIQADAVSRGPGDSWHCGNPLVFKV